MTLDTKSLTFQEVLDLPLRDVLASAGRQATEAPSAPVRTRSLSRAARPVALFIATRLADRRGVDVSLVRGGEEGKDAWPVLSDPIVFLSKREALSYANHYDALLIGIQWDKSEERYGKGVIVRLPIWSVDGKNRAGSSQSKTRVKTRQKPKTKSADAKIRPASARTRTRKTKKARRG